MGINDGYLQQNNVGFVPWGEEEGHAGSADPVLASVCSCLQRQWRLSTHDKLPLVTAGNQICR